MLIKLLIQAVGASLGFFLAAQFVPGVKFPGNFADYALAGALFAVFNAGLSPILKAITFPLRMLTFNLFSLVIDIAMVWVVNVFVRALEISGLSALFLTTVIIMIINSILWKILSPSRR